MYRPNRVRSPATARMCRTFAVLRGLFIALPLFLLAEAPAVAQGGPDGIGFAQAEEGIWSCRAGDPVTGLNCARDLCRAEANGQDCFRTAWCFPSGWAGVLTVFLPEFHNTRAVCGAPSLEALLAALQAFCDHSPDAVSCVIRLVYDPTGAPQDIERETVPAVPALVPVR